VPPVFVGLSSYQCLFAGGRRNIAKCGKRSESIALQ